MARVLVAGMINVETNLRIEGFPLGYHPVTYPFHGVTTNVSGAAWNVGKALAGLGHDVRFVSLVGDDALAELVRRDVRGAGVDDGFVLTVPGATCQSVILVDPDGRRQVHTDLKDLQESTTVYPADTLAEAMDGCDVAVVGNMNMCRDILRRVREEGIPTAIDVHVLHDLHDAYDREFLAGADTLMVSDEGLDGRDPRDYLRAIQETYPAATTVILGRGADGATVRHRRGDDVEIHDVAAVAPRGVVNTVGAGDALLSGYVHAVLGGASPRDALVVATTFAGWKVGVSGASTGLTDAKHLAELVAARP